MRGVVLLHTVHATTQIQYMRLEKKHFQYSNQQAEGCMLSFQKVCPYLYMLCLVTNTGYLCNLHHKSALKDSSLATTEVGDQQKHHSNRERSSLLFLRHISPSVFVCSEC